jgi:hypothetical protein
MNVMTRKKLIGVLLKTFALFIVISFIYVLIIHKPQSSESIIKNYLVARQAPLIENRLAIMQIVSLDPNSPRFYDDQSQVYYLVTKSHEDGLKLISESLPEEASEELVQAYPEMKSVFQAVLESNSEFVEKQKEIDRKLTKVFEYSPSLDLSEVDADTATVRVNSALEGLRKVKDSYPESSKLIDDVQAALTGFKTTKNLNALDKAYRDFKIELYKLKIKPLAEKEELDILAKQTTLINKFEYFTDSLDR